MDNDQQIRAAAVQAATNMTNKTSDVIYTEDVLAAYIKDGISAQRFIKAQQLADDASRASTRAQVQYLQDQADKGGVLKVVVSAGDGYGSLAEWLTFRWKQLPRGEG